MPSRQEKVEKPGNTKAGSNTENKIVSFRCRERYGITLHGEDMANGKHAGYERDTQKAGGSQGGMSAAVVEEEEYGYRVVEESMDWVDHSCRIVEEQPPDY